MLAKSTVSAYSKLQEGESDNEFNFHEAETESDSDDNQSTQDAQRSVQTGATAGSDTGEENFLFVHISGSFLSLISPSILCVAILNSLPPPDFEAETNSCRFTINQSIIKH